jgi:hypothetical protein
MDTGTDRDNQKHSTVHEGKRLGHGHNRTEYGDMQKKQDLVQMVYVGPESSEQMLPAFFEIQYWRDSETLGCGAVGCSDADAAALVIRWGRFPCF